MSIADEVFGMAENCFNVINYREKVRLATKKLEEATAKKCGNCNHWMISSRCKREQVYQARNLKLSQKEGDYISMEDFACSDFDRNNKERVGELKAKLKAIFKEGNRGG